MKDNYSRKHYHTSKGKYYMKVSSITDSRDRRNLFIEYANSFMNFKANPDENTENNTTNPVNQEKKLDKKMGIETLTIFPKQVIDGKTIITA